MITKLTDIFVSPDEELLAVLGQKNLDGALKMGICYACFCVVTDRHLYVRGLSYLNGGTYDECRKDLTFNLGAIRGARFISVRFIYQAFLTLMQGFGGTMLLALTVIWGFLLTGCIYNYEIQSAFFLGVYYVYLVLSVASDYMRKHDLLLVEYMGGSIAFPVSSYEMKEMKKFQADLTRVLAAHNAAKNAKTGANITI